ncbi:MAG TPA: glycosyltransferase family 39 protein [Pseudonocardiaceae bacterium]|jgi:4-amino-4-deoxy-L-arabinose transferase-like glycosyltransferase|nr:glycosyltransferase family 39 protein [Pseudonocardiaceae bacterium]
MATPTIARSVSSDTSEGPTRGRLGRLLRGPADQPKWAQSALLILLAGTAVLYLWDLGASGYANSFYAAAVQAGTQSWKAWLFGSLDSSNAITVDKPPAAFWVMGLSARIFGFNSWSMLVPDALAGVASVGLLYGAVRRWSGPAAGLFAGAALALTPVAALMFRFNNPDAILVLLLVGGAYCVVRATEKASPKWLMLAGVLIGFGFLTKMLQAFLVLPAFALVYLIAAPTGLGRRIRHVLLSGLALIVSAGWYVLLVQLWPADARPYIGGSTNNNLLELAFGYNGLGRIFGGSGNGGGGGGPAGGGGGGFGGANVSFGGDPGIGRLFGASFGTEISWLLPAALIALVAGLWFSRKAPRTDRVRASLILWGGWLLVTGLVFSFMQGTIHPYYMVALAPAIAGLLGVAGRELWRGRDHLLVRGTLALMVAATGIWDFVLLDRTPTWAPALRYVVLVAGLLVAAALVFGVRRFAKSATVLLLVTAITTVAGSAAYAVDTASQPEVGPIPTSGPSTSGFGGRSGAPAVGYGGAGDAAGAGGAGAPGDGGGRVGGFGGVGGRGGGATTNSALTNLLKATNTTWAAATIGSNSAAPLELASGKAVMAIGGFTGSDPSPTLAQFEQDVAAGKIHYFIAGGFGGGGLAVGVGNGGADGSATGGTGGAPAGGFPGGSASGGRFGGGGFGGGEAPAGGFPGGGGRGGFGGSSGDSGAITSWVEAHYSSTTVGGETVYDLTKPKTTG